MIVVSGVNSDRSQRFATAEVDYELFGTCIFLTTTEAEWSKAV